jgi:hypothetical protein
MGGVEVEAGILLAEELLQLGDAGAFDGLAGDGALEDVMRLVLGVEGQLVIEAVVDVNVREGSLLAVLDDALVLDIVLVAVVVEDFIGHVLVSPRLLCPIVRRWAGSVSATGGIMSGADRDRKGQLFARGSVGVSAMSAAPLEYAPRPPLTRRRRFRWIVLVCLLLAALYPGWRYGPGLWKRSVMLHHQRGCLTYRAPADLVVYESSQPAANELLGRAGYVPLAITEPGSYGNPGPVAAYVPAALRDFERSIGGTVTSGATAVLFLHERRAKNGARRLIVVQRGAMNFTPFLTPFDLMVTVFDPATFRKDLKVVPPSNAHLFVWNGPVSLVLSKDLRFYAGQADPADAARFTIRYSMEGQEGVVEGRLSDDGTEVKVEIKSGPAAESLWARPLVRDRG